MDDDHAMMHTCQLVSTERLVTGLLSLEVSCAHNRHSIQYCGMPTCQLSHWLNVLATYLHHIDFEGRLWKGLLHVNV